MKIFVEDGQPPEVVAMLQALYSRSPCSVVKHLEDVKVRGADKFMSTYYVGYGHKSIGDCGTTSVFIEDVSMLAAKAVQDTPLYSGQEASTRYLDMTKQAMVDPLGTPESSEVQGSWMVLYRNALDDLVPALKEKHPRQPDEKEGVWEKAIKARAFDIARSLLPAGTTTYVSWHVNLRQAHDHILEMSCHPLEEVRDVAARVRETLVARYPASFGHVVLPPVENYVIRSMERFGFHYEPINQFSDNWTNVDLVRLEGEKVLLSERPLRAELHQRFRRFGQIEFRFPLDFGSYRDLQRQRSAVQEMPLLTTNLGFHPWYLSNLPGWIAERVEVLRRRVDRLDCSDEVRQYYLPMGFQVPVVMTCTLPSAAYIAELRSGQTVHPTLRVIAQNMAHCLKREIPYLALHVDHDEDRWSVKRGTQDIVKVDAPEGASETHK